MQTKTKPSHSTLACPTLSTSAPNRPARLAITLTTAVVIVESAALSAEKRRARSTCGAPRKTQIKHGTNVTHVVSAAPSVAATN